MTANIVASLTLKLNAIGNDKLIQLVKGLDQTARAAAVGGSQLKGTEQAVAALAAKARPLRTLEQELLKLGTDAENVKTRMAASEIFHGPNGEPPIVAKLRTVENEMVRLGRLTENRKITQAAKDALGTGGGSFWDGHGFTNGPRKVLGAFRDIGGAIYGVKATAGALIGTMHALVDPAKEFEATMAEVRNKGGFDASSTTAISNMIKEMGKTSQFAPTQAANAAVELAAAGMDAAGTKEALPSVLRFSQAGGLNTEQSAGLLVDTMSQFGMQAKDFEKIGNVMVKAANMSTIGVHEIGESFKYVGPIARTAGISIESLTGMIAFMGERGIKGSEAGTALRKVITSLVHPTKQARQAMTEMGITKKQLQDGLTDLPAFLAKLSEKMDTKHLNSAQKLEINKMLFGTEGMTAVDILMRGATTLGTDGKTQIDAYTDALHKAGDAMKNAADIASKTTAGSFARLHARTETLLISVGDKLAPALNRAMDGLEPLINKVTAFISNSGSLVEVAARGAITAAGLAMLGLPNIIKLATGPGRLAALALGQSTGATMGAAFGTAASAAASVAVLAVTAGIGFMIGDKIADALGREKIGSALWESIHGTKDRDIGDGKDPALVALEKQRKEKRDAMSAKPVEGEIALVIKDERTQVTTQGKDGLRIKPIRTGANMTDYGQGL